MGLQISGEYFEYRITTQITGIIVKHQLWEKSRVVSFNVCRDGLNFGFSFLRDFACIFPFLILEGRNHTAGHCELVNSARFTLCVTSQTVVFKL